MEHFIVMYVDPKHPAHGWLEAYTGANRDAAFVIFRAMAKDRPTKMFDGLGTCIADSDDKELLALESQWDGAAYTKKNT